MIQICDVIFRSSSIIYRSTTITLFRIYRVIIIRIFFFFFIDHCFCSDTVAYLVHLLIRGIRACAVLSVHPRLVIVVVAAAARSAPAECTNFGLRNNALVFFSSIDVVLFLSRSAPV